MKHLSILRLLKLFISILFLFLPIRSHSLSSSIAQAYFSTLFDAGFGLFLYSSIILTACIYLFLSGLLEFKTPHDSLLCITCIIILISVASQNLVVSVGKGGVWLYLSYSCFLLSCMGYLLHKMIMWKKGISVIDKLPK